MTEGKENKRRGLKKKKMGRVCGKEDMDGWGDECGCRDVDVVVEVDVDGCTS